MLLCKSLVQEYVRQLGQHLLDQNGQPNPDARLAMETLCVEAFCLIFALRIFNPQVANKLHAGLVGTSSQVPQPQLGDAFYHQLVVSLAAAFTGCLYRLHTMLLIM